MAGPFRGQEIIAEIIGARVRETPGVGETEGPFDAVYEQNVRPGTVKPPSPRQELPGAVPVRCWFVIPIPGPSTSKDIGGQGTDPSDWAGIYPDSFQIVSRGSIDNEGESWEMADAAFRALDNYDASSYFAVDAETRPQWFRRDDTRCHEHIFTVTARRCQ